MTLILELYRIGAVKFGSFTLKSGKISPIYLDLRPIVSFPIILQQIADALWQKIAPLSFDLVCGVPYTALPIATALSLSQKIPMILQRKEEKQYGTKKKLEGVFEKGQRCLILEDVITTGSSVLETARSLKEENLTISDVAVVIDRGQGGRENLLREGLNVHSLFSLHEILELLKREEKISETVKNEVSAWLKS